MDPEEKEKLRLRREKQERHEVERGERDPFARKRAVNDGARRGEAGGGRARHDRRTIAGDARAVPLLDEEDLHGSDVIVTVTAIHRTEIEVDGAVRSNLLIWKALSAPATPHVLAVGDRIVLEPEFEDAEEDDLDEDEESQWTLVGRLDRRTVLARADPQDATRTRWLASNVDAILVAIPEAGLGDQEPFARRASAWFAAAGIETLWVTADEGAAKTIAAFATKRSQVVAKTTRDAVLDRLADRSFLVLGVDESSRHALLETLGLPVPGPSVRVRADAAKVMPDMAKATHVQFENGALWLDALTLRTLAAADLKAADLPHAFPEWQHAPACEAGGCTHREEAGCAVRAAMAEHESVDDRHAAFVRLADVLGV